MGLLPSSHSPPFLTPTPIDHSHTHLGILGLVMEVDEGRGICLPPGFRFHPMDEEIITHYLWQKVVDSRFSATAIGEVDLNKCEPWDLPYKAKMGEKEWYFFCHRDRKYPTGMRTNRATEAGYWKATGKDKEILKGKDNNLVGMKKTLVFYKGRAPRGEKTNWVMHEYRLEGKSSYQNFPPNAKDEWVVCRVFHKNTEIKRNSDGFSVFSINAAFVDELLDLPTLPPLMEAPQENERFNFNDPLTNFNSFSTTLAPNSSFYTQILPEASLIPNYHHGRSNCRNVEDYSYQPTLQQSASQETMISSEKNQEISSLGLMEVGFNQYYDDIDNLWK